MGESAFIATGGGDEARRGIEQVLSQGPGPEFVVQLTDEFERLFARLADSDLRTIASLRMQGYTIDEISAQVGRAPATIERKLKVIRTLWEKELA